MRLVRPPVRPSVCLSVTYGLLTRKQKKNFENQKFVWTYPTATVARLEG